MKILLAIFLPVLIIQQSISQINPFIDSIYSVIKSKGVYSQDANWTVIEQKFKHYLTNAKNDKDSIKSLVRVFENLGDVHSSIYYKGQQFGNYPVFDDSTLATLIPLMTRSQKEEGIIRTPILENKFAYIQIPGIQAWGDKTNEYAQAIADSVCKLSAKKVSGFIIDLPKWRRSIECYTLRSE